MFEWTSHRRHQTTRSHEVRSRTSAPHLSRLSTTCTFPERHISTSNDTIFRLKIGILDQGSSGHQETSYNKNHQNQQTRRSPHSKFKKMASGQDPNTTTATQQQEEKPWHASFPAPRLEAGVMPAARAQMILSMKIASMLIIDVRRTDYEGGAVRGSLNIPAQGFWWNRGML